MAVIYDTVMRPVVCLTGFTELQHSRHSKLSTICGATEKKAKAPALYGTAGAFRRARDLGSRFRPSDQRGQNVFGSQSVRGGLKDSLFTFHRRTFTGSQGMASNDPHGG